MQSILVLLAIVTGIAIVGALVETFLPGLITETMKSNLSALTMAIIGILLSFSFLMWFLKLRIREGFEDSSLQSQWNQMVTTNKLNEICTLYTEMYEKTLTVEKGAPPEQVKTDAQARESTDAKFAAGMTVPLLSCHLIDKVNSAEGLDSFYAAIQKVPNTLLVQAYETAISCRRLLIDSYLKVQQAELKQKEAFEDKPLCDEDVAKERKLQLAAQQCILPEEVPQDKKEKVILQKLEQIQSTFTSYQKKDSIDKILEDCKYYKGELEKKKKAAEDLSNQTSLK